MNGKVGCMAGHMKGSDDVAMDEGMNGYCGWVSQTSGSWTWAHMTHLKRREHERREGTSGPHIGGGFRC